jgi:hypothetical protein
LNSSTVFAIVFVTVPAFGLGINHLGHKTFAIGAKSLIQSGVVNKISKSVFQALIASNKSEEPNTSAPDFLASSNLSSVTKTATLFDFQVPLGKIVVALIT